MPPIGVQFGTAPSQNAALQTALPFAAAGIVTGTAATIFTLDGGAYTGYVITRVVMRTLAAITGFAVPPAIAIAWTAAFVTACMTGTAPTAANTATVFLPPASPIPYGTPGQALVVKPTAAITGPGAGTYYFDIYGYQIP